MKTTNYPAYLVFHDAFDGGAMDVWPYLSLATAQAEAEARQNRLEQSGDEEAGHWTAYEQLPADVPVYKLYEPAAEPAAEPETETPAEENLLFVAVYQIDRAYGGPQEGGWYYDTGILVSDPTVYRTLGIQPAVFASIDAAVAHRDRLAAAIERVGLNEGLHSPSSVLSEGEWHAAEVHEFPPPAFYPATRPHYE